MNNKDCKLTTQQIKCLQHAMMGLSAKESAILLGLSTLTVQWHRRKIIKRLDARNMTNAACIAAANGIVYQDWSGTHK